MSPRWRRRVLVALLAGTALNALVYVAYTVPRSLGEKRLAERRGVLLQEVQRERVTVAELRREAETIQANTQDVRQFYEAAVGGRSASLVPVLRAIEGMAREGGLRPGPATYRPQEVKGAALNRFLITMPVTGSYRQLVGFVQRLERSPYFLTLDEVRFSGEAKSHEAELAMVLSCYFRTAAEGPR